MWAFIFQFSTFLYVGKYKNVKEILHSKTDTKKYGDSVGGKSFSGLMLHTLLTSQNSPSFRTTYISIPQIPYSPYVKCPFQELLPHKLFTMFETARNQYNYGKIF